MKNKPMTIKEYFVYCVKGEKPAFIRVMDVIEKLPRKKLEYKPDPKSKTGFELAATFAREAKMICRFLKDGKIDFVADNIKYTNATEIKKDLVKYLNEMVTRAQKMSETEWDTEYMAWEK